MSGTTPRGQPWTPALALPHRRDGLSARRMAVLYTFREPSLGRQMHRELMRNALLDLTTIMPATTCHRRSYVETYSRFIGGSFRKYGDHPHSCATHWFGVPHIFLSAPLSSDAVAFSRSRGEPHLRDGKLATS